VDAVTDPYAGYRPDCPRCNGTGETGPVLACGPSGSTLLDKAVCWVCRGEKTITREQAERMDLGQRVRAKRLERSITQDGLAVYLGIDRVAYSKAESLGLGDDWTFGRLEDWLESAP
jgi:DNA-binding XRE family transcriptional regulator